MVSVIMENATVKKVSDQRTVQKKFAKIIVIIMAYV
jgi:hypothetical protein